MLKLLLLFVAALSSTHVYADAKADEARIRAALKKNNPQIEKIDKVVKSDILGLYEVAIQGRLLYTDKDGRYIINGNIFEMKTMRNLTEARARELFKVEYSKLPFELAMKRVKGNGQRQMAYFTDPNCGYCQKLETELKQLDNITLHVFLLANFPGSAEKIKGVLCSKNPVKAWDDLMLNQVVPATGTCDTPMDKVAQLSNTLNVNGTPAMIFSNGVLEPGYLSAADIEKALVNGGKAVNSGKAAR